MKYFFLSPLGCFWCFFVAEVTTKTTFFHDLHLVFLDAHRCRGEKLLPRISGLKLAKAALGAGLRGFQRCLGWFWVVRLGVYTLVLEKISSLRACRVRKSTAAKFWWEVDISGI